MLLVWIDAFGAGEPLKFQLASAGEHMATIAAIDIEAKATDRYMLVPLGTRFCRGLSEAVKDMSEWLTMQANGYSLPIDRLGLMADYSKITHSTLAALTLGNVTTDYATGVDQSRVKHTNQCQDCKPDASVDPCRRN